uniref:Bifunctional inhibitor/plant lipid transfer protein/seed storage helical domain-containing protein n=1 Tax=Oryza rufipogon TaxID=4529 RepID=A0A0E0P5E0_ORYRU
MAPSKSIVVVVFALFAVAASLPPSAAARDAQVFKPTVAVDAVRQEQQQQQQPAVNAIADVSQPSTSLVGLPGLPPLPPLPTIQIPGLPPLPQLPAIQIPGLPPLQPLPTIQIPGLPPLPQLPTIQIPGLPTLQPIPAIQIPGLPPLQPLPTIQIPGLPPLPQLPTIQIPGLPPLPPLPSIPITPGSPGAAEEIPINSQSALATTSNTPQVITKCLSSLMQLMPCMEYLTKADEPAPPSICCDGFKSLVEKAPICLCHGINGDISKFMPAPIDFARMMSLPATCGVAPPVQALTKCFTGPVPPLMPAPTPAAAPSPGPSA